MPFYRDSLRVLALKKAYKYHTINEAGDFECIFTREDIVILHLHTIN